jgi:hypothetical protein
MVNLFNYNLLICSIVICTAIFVGYFLYCLIKNSYLSKNITATTNNSSSTKIETISNNKNVTYRYITKISLIPSSELNGDLSAYTIYELKFEEMYLVYGREIVSFRVTEEEVWDTITSFEPPALYANDINEIILTILSYIHP